MWDNGNGTGPHRVRRTAGSVSPTCSSASLWSWRSNVLFRSSDRDLADGMTFDSTPRDIVGQSRIDSQPQIPFVEISRIPTAGIAADGMQYMSSCPSTELGRARQWETNYSRLAFSTDNGENWVEATETRVHPSAGTHTSRWVRSSRTASSSTSTAPRRAAAASCTSPASPRSRCATGTPTSTGRRQVGAEEPRRRRPDRLRRRRRISVQYHSYLGQYLMLTTTTTTLVVMLRAPSPTGPWSAPEVLIAGPELPSITAHTFTRGRPGPTSTS